MNLIDRIPTLRFQNLMPLFLILLEGVSLYFLASHVVREQFVLYLLLFGICFLISVVFYFRSTDWGFSFAWILLSALGFRLLFLFSMPALSDDYFRYFFDGHLVTEGINPYLFTPDIALEMLPGECKELWEELFAGMNSKNYYTIYPPLHQGVFYLVTVGTKSVMESVIRVRLFLMLFDLANIFLLRKLINDGGIKSGALALYAFSPLVVLECVGNLHFEGIILTCLLATVLFLQKKQVRRAALAWASAIGLKLVPLILAPIWLFRLRESSFLRFISVSLVALALFFSPFLNVQVLENFFESFQLFQRKFEFNSSLYYIVREISMWFVPYNPIKYVVPTLGLVSLVLIFLISTHNRGKGLLHLPRTMVWVYMAYLLFQPVVHPWYLIPIFGLGILAREWTPVIWSGLVAFSYAAYQNSPVEEQPVFLLLQYGPLFLHMAYRFLCRRPLLKTGI